MKAVLALFALVAASTLGDWFYGLWHGPEHLACHGKWLINQSTDSLHVEINLSAGTVTIFGQFKIEHSGAEGVDFTADDSPSGGTTSYGHIYRYTGAIWFYSSIRKDEFEGLCHKAEPLF